jgi:hypothetical protein
MPTPTGPQWSDFSPQEQHVPDEIMDSAKSATKAGAAVARKGFDSASKGTQVATLATAAAGVLGAAGGVLPVDTGLMVAASSPILPFARHGVEHLVSMHTNPERLPLKRALSPSRFVKGLLDPPGTPKRR